MRDLDQVIDLLEAIATSDNPQVAIDDLEYLDAELQHALWVAGERAAVLEESRIDEEE